MRFIRCDSVLFARIGIREFIIILDQEKKYFSLKIYIFF